MRFGEGITELSRLGFGLKIDVGEELNMVDSELIEVIARAEEFSLVGELAAGFD